MYICSVQGEIRFEFCHQHCVLGTEFHLGCLFHSRVRTVETVLVSKAPKEERQVNLTHFLLTDFVSMT